MSKKYLWGAVILVVLLVAVGIMLKSDTSLAPQGSPSASPNAGTMPLSPTPSKAPAASGKPSAVAPGMSYDSALKMYEGKRIQFDEFCQASPNALVVKSGSSIMFDNRSGDARWISLDGVGFYISGHGFRIIPMTPKSVPHTTIMGCGSATSVGKITIVQ
jgi:hypothetical protein